MANLVLTPKPFQLVNFITPGKRSVTRSVDITLLKWIRWNKTNKKFVTRYMPPPYNEETNNVLYDLIQKQADVPDDNWPDYVIKIVGHADTYEEGVERLNELKIKEYAFTESETEPAKKAELITNQIKQQTELFPDLQSIMDVPELERPIASTSKLNIRNSSTSKAKTVNSSDIQAQEVEHDSLISTSDEENDFRHNVIQIKKRKIHSSIEQDLEDSVGEYLESLKEINLSKDEDPNEAKVSKVMPNSLKASKIKDQLRNSDRKITGNLNKGNKNLTIQSNSQDRLFSAKDETNYASIMKEIKLLRLDVREVRDYAKNLIGMLEHLNNTNIIDKQCFEEKYNLNLPLKTVEELDTLDEQLKNDQDCNQHFKSSLSLSLNKEIGIRKVLNIIIKKYLSRDVVLKFTVIKSIPGKRLFKDLQFCSTLIAITSEKFQTAEEDILSHISNIFGNAKDWDGHRKKRVEK